MVFEELEPPGKRRRRDGPVVLEEFTDWASEAVEELLDPMGPGDVGGRAQRLWKLAQLLALGASEFSGRGSQAEAWREIEYALVKSFKTELLI